MVRENRTTCLMAEFAAKFIVPYDVWASNYVDVSGVRDQGIGRGEAGSCGTRVCSAAAAEPLHAVTAAPMGKGTGSGRGGESVGSFGKSFILSEDVQPGRWGGLWVSGGTLGPPL